jgi:hypothetical protein
MLRLDIDTLPRVGIIANLCSTVYEHSAPRGLDLADALPRFEVMIADRMSQKPAAS